MWGLLNLFLPQSLKQVLDLYCLFLFFVSTTFSLVSLIETNYLRANAYHLGVKTLTEMLCNLKFLSLSIMLPAILRYLPTMVGGGGEQELDEANLSAVKELTIAIALQLSYHGAWGAHLIPYLK